MTPADQPAFLAVLNGLAAIKPGKGLTAEALDLWWLAMREWSLADFKAAASHLAKSHEFMPSPFHFEQLRKAGRPTAGEAWAKVLDYVRKGYTRWTDGGISANGTAPQLDDLTLRVVAALGGFDQIAMCQNDKLHFLERRFAEHHADMQDSQDVRVAVPQIAGTQLERLAGDVLKRIQ